MLLRSNVGNSLGCGQSATLHYHKLRYFAMAIAAIHEGYLPFWNGNWEVVNRRQLDPTVFAYTFPSNVVPAQAFYSGVRLDQSWSARSGLAGGAGRGRARAEGSSPARPRDEAQPLINQRGNFSK